MLYLSVVVVSPKERKEKKKSLANNFGLKARRTRISPKEIELIPNAVRRDVLGVRPEALPLAATEPMRTVEVLGSSPGPGRKIPLGGIFHSTEGQVDSQPCGC